MPDDQAVERGARALADEYYGVGWDEASDRHDNLRSEARTVLEAATELPEWDCPNCGAVTRAQMADHPTPIPDKLAEAEVIARHAGTLNWWAELVMNEYDRLRTEPVLAPNALDASAERWQLYAAKLETTLGELRGERDRLRAALKRSVADAELQWSGKSMPENELDEFADHIAHPNDAT